MTLYEWHRIPLRALFSLAARVRLDGIERLPPQGGVVVVSNHLSMLDPLLLGAAFRRQLHFMAKEELFAIKPLGFWLRQAGTFPVRRGENDRAALRHAEGLLREGKVVMLFPEGQRSDSAGLQNAQAGAVLLAARTSSPILPVAITGTERLRPAQGLHPLLQRLWQRPVVRVRAGSPIWLDDVQRIGGRKAAAAQVMRQIVAMLPPSYHGIYAEGGSPPV